MPSTASQWHFAQPCGHVVPLEVTQCSASDCQQECLCCMKSWQQPITNTFRLLHLQSHTAHQHMCSTSLLLPCGDSHVKHKHRWSVGLYQHCFADGAGPSSNADSRDGQPSSRELFFKTRLCDKFMQFGDCPYGDRCHYAHGPQDLREKGSVAVGVTLLHVCICIFACLANVQLLQL